MQKFLNRYTLWQKFLVLGLLGGVLVLVPLYLYVNESNKAIAAAQLEVSGIAPTHEMLNLVHLVQQHGNLSGADQEDSAYGQAELQGVADHISQQFAQLDQHFKNAGMSPEIMAAWTDAQTSWTAFAEQFRTGALANGSNPAAHAEVVTKLLKVNELLVDYFGLSLDPEIDSYYLVDAGLTQSPALTEDLQRAKEKGMSILRANAISAADKAIISALASNVTDRYETQIASLNKAGKANPELAQRLTPRVGATTSATTKALHALQNDLENAAQNGTRPAEFNRQFNLALEEQQRLHETIVQELDGILKLRVDSLSENKAILVGVVVALAIAAAYFAYQVIRSINLPLLEAIRVTRRVADGDLTTEIQVDSTNETGQLLQALKDMNQSLVKIVGEVRYGTSTIASASSQIASGNLDLSARTEQQAGSLEETASSMEQLTSTVKQNAESARQASELAQIASEIAIKGGQVVGQVIGTMGSINESAKKIADIIGVIDGIAFQTNILALNAAVEAARAGEQGKGFSVVAAEVRSLAQRSAEAAKEIKTLITDSVGKVESGTELVDQAGATMEDVVRSVRRVTELISEITRASMEQTSGIEQINRAITHMDGVTQQNASLVEEAAAAAEALYGQADVLSRLVSTFKIDSSYAAMAPVIAASETVPLEHLQKMQETTTLLTGTAPAVNEEQFRHAANEAGAGRRNRDRL